MLGLTGNFFKINCNGTDATLINEMEKAKARETLRRTELILG